MLANSQRPSCVEALDCVGTGHTRPPLHYKVQCRRNLNTRGKQLKGFNRKTDGQNAIPENPYRTMDRRDAIPVKR